MVTLQTEYVLKEFNPVMMKKRLKSLPTTPTEAYRDTLERMSSSMRDFARQILSWILRAQRVLEIDELCEVLAIEVGVACLDCDMIPAPDLVVSTCGGLITYDQGNGSVTFSHETVRPFLEENEIGNLLSHSDICTTCLTYLRFPYFENPRELSKTFYGPTPPFQFGRYAAEFWAFHVLQGRREPDLERAILETFSLDARRQSVAYILVNFKRISIPTLLQYLIEQRVAFIFMSPFPET
jgi:hypothetical protein